MATMSCFQDTTTSTVTTTDDHPLHLPFHLPQDPTVLAWVKQQNAATVEELGSTPEFEEMQATILSIYEDKRKIPSTNDDRVHPAHTRKMAHKMLQQGHPIFYYENTEGGHSGAANLKQSAFEAALVISYLRKQLC